MRGPFFVYGLSLMPLSWREDERDIENFEHFIKKFRNSLPDQNFRSIFS
jgi:hypothetical protein